MLNDHMLVRIGGGWDTLEHYLMTHAPSKEGMVCRLGCTLLCYFGLCLEVMESSRGLRVSDR